MSDAAPESSDDEEQGKTVSGRDRGSTRRVHDVTPYRVRKLMLSGAVSPR